MEGWFRSRTFLVSLASALLLAISFPPIGWSWVALVAPIGWLRLIHLPRLDGRRPYGELYLTSFVFWLLVTHWVRLPHWSAGFGWIVLSAYLACYIPLWMGISRWFVHGPGPTDNFPLANQLRSWLIPSLVWVTLEWIRGIAFTGFSLALLGHSQVAQLPLLQIASITGGYGVSFLVLLTASSLERFLGPDPKLNLRRFHFSALWGFAPIILAVIWGQGRIQDRTRSDDAESSIQVVIAQSSLDTVFDVDPKMATERSERGFRECQDLSLRAVAAHPEVDLVIWPESMFGHYGTIVQYDQGVETPVYWQGENSISRSAEICRRNAAATVAQIGVPCLVGTETIWCGTEKLDRYNSAALFDGRGELQGLYHKMHPVMFGEYVPLGDLFPWLYRLTPMGGGLTPGREPVALRVKDMELLPSICFEDTVPHLIRRQLSSIRSTGREPNILVNLTNDGWFWGSSLLDLHWTCAVFRAVELDKPMIVSANTGFSGSIDGCGRVLQKGPRRAPGYLEIELTGSTRTSFYSIWGDWFPLTSCGALFMLGITRRRAGGRRS